jgi:hypothetical protein
MMRTAGTQYESYEGAQEEAQEVMKNIQKYVDNHMEKERNRQARYYNQGRRDVTYAPGQLVVVRTHPISSAQRKFAAKLSDVWCGPYEVLEMFNNVNVKLRDVKNPRKIIHRHVVEMQPYIERYSSKDGSVVDHHHDIHEPPNLEVMQPASRGESPIGSGWRETQDDEQSVASSARGDQPRYHLRARDHIHRPDTYQAGAH